MDALTHFFEALGLIFQWHNLLAVIAGNVFGLIIGATPGLTITAGMIFLLPTTFYLPTVTSISLLLGLYSSGMTGGAISAIMLNIPGTPSAAATAIEGHKLAQKGRAGEAVGMAVISSVFGEFFSLVVLIFLSPIVAKAALNFGAPELFALMILGLSIVSSFGKGSPKELIKSFITATLGLIFITIGFDTQTGTPRFTLGVDALTAGVHILPVMVGLYAIPQVLSGVRKEARKKWLSRYRKGVTAKLPTMGDVKRSFKYLMLGSGIGTFTGALPGAGGFIAVFIAYSYAKRISGSLATKFGTGILEGIAAPESANNGVEGGALIPMLTLGIPGDPVTAVLLGALLIQGVTPGPLLFEMNPELIWAIFAALFAATIFNFVIVFAGAKFAGFIYKIPQQIVLSLIALFSVIGSYAVRSNPMDVGIMIFFGLLSFVMKKYGFPILPLLLAVVLGPFIEEHLRISLILSQGNPSIFVTHPISLAFLILAVLSFGLPLLNRGKATFEEP